MESPRLDQKYNVNPFGKPVKLYDMLLDIYVRENGSVIELFAGTCRSIHKCMEKGANLTLVEKDDNQEELFGFSFEDACNMLISNHKVNCNQIEIQRSLSHSVPSSPGNCNYLFFIRSFYKKTIKNN